MQGAKTSKSCSSVGAVYIYTNQPASKRFGKINNFTIDPKMNENSIENHQKHDADKHRQILFKIRQPVAWLFRQVARFCCNLFFGTSGGYPLGPILASSAARLVGLSWPFGRFQELICSEFQRFQGNKWHQPHLQQKQARIQKTKHTGNQSKQIIFYFFGLTKPRKSEAPGLEKIGSAELPKG